MILTQRFSRYAPHLIFHTLPHLALFAFLQRQHEFSRLEVLAQTFLSFPGPSFSPPWPFIPLRRIEGRQAGRHPYLSRGNQAHVSRCSLNTCKTYSTLEIIITNIIIIMSSNNNHSCTALFKNQSTLYLFVNFFHWCAKSLKERIKNKNSSWYLQLVAQCMAHDKVSVDVC